MTSRDVIKQALPNLLLADDVGQSKHFRVLDVINFWIQDTVSRTSHPTCRVHILYACEEGQVEEGRKG